MRLLDSNHKRLTAAALATGALMFVALIGPFSDRTFYCFLVAFVGFSVLAILDAAERKVTQILNDELDPDPFNERLTWVAPIRAYDCTAITPGKPERNWRNLTTGDLAALLHQLDVPSYEADADRGDTTVTGTHITWQPSTHTTGDNR